MRAREITGRSGNWAGWVAGLAAALIILAALSGLPACAAAADSPEDLAFRPAIKLFQDGLYASAETSFSTFLTTFTNSSHRASALLYLARSRLEQSNYAGAIELLLDSYSGAAGLAQEYVFWTAKARLARGDYQLAADGFANVVSNNSLASPFLLEASYDEAEAYAKQSNWTRVIGILQPGDGAFHVAAAAQPTNEFASMGVLLLGEALFTERRYEDAERALGGLDPSGLKTSLRWRRQLLLCQIKLAAGPLPGSAGQQRPVARSRLRRPASGGGRLPARGNPGKAGPPCRRPPSLHKQSG